MRDIRKKGWDLNLRCTHAHIGFRGWARSTTPTLAMGVGAAPKALARRRCLHAQVVELFNSLIIVQAMREASNLAARLRPATGVGKGAIRLPPSHTATDDGRSARDIDFVRTACS